MLALYSKLLAVGVVAIMATSSPITAAINFKVKFQGINDGGPDQKVDITFKQNGALINTFYSFPVTTDANGIYSGTIENIVPGVYDVYIKNNVRLGVKINDVNIATGLNSEDWSNELLLAGDFNNDNKLNIQDIRLLLSSYKDLNVPVSSNNEIYDVNGDGVLDIKDIGLVLSNYIAFEVPGE